MCSYSPNGIVRPFAAVSITYTGQWRMRIPPDAKTDLVSKWGCRTSTGKSVLYDWQVGALLKVDSSKVSFMELLTLDVLIELLSKSLRYQQQGKEETWPGVSTLRWQWKDRWRNSSWQW